MGASVTEEHIAQRILSRRSYSWNVRRLLESHLSGTGGFELQDSLNGGIVSNVSEDGIALSAANLLFEDQFTDLRIQGPAANEWIELTGQIA